MPLLLPSVPVGAEADSFPDALEWPGAAQPRARLLLGQLIPPSSAF